MVRGRPPLGNLKRYCLTDQAERYLKDLYAHRQSTDVRVSHSHIVCDAIIKLHEQDIGTLNMSDVLSDYIANRRI